MLRVTRAQIAAAAQCSFHYHFPCSFPVSCPPFSPQHFRGFSIMSSYVSAGNLRWQLQLSACKLPHLPPTCSGIQGIPTVRRDSPCPSLPTLFSPLTLVLILCVAFLNAFKILSNIFDDFSSKASFPTCCCLAICCCRFSSLLLLLLLATHATAGHRMRPFCPLFAQKYTYTQIFHWILRAALSIARVPS